LIADVLDVLLVGDNRGQLALVIGDVSGGPFSDSFLC
jgi:hypothetical protein